MKKANKKSNKKNWLYLGSGFIAILIIVILTLATGKDPAPQVLASNDSGKLIINKADITKTATFYPYESNGTYMEIIAIKANDGTVRTALNTCQICYSSGRGYYEQLGDVLICNNCGNQFTIDQIELVKGGCNPIPIFDDMKIENDDTIAISSESLAVFEPFFANWKR